MKKLKDFFYNKNDIFIVLIIVAIAAFIIYTRVDSIMTYPEKQASKIAQQEASKISEPVEETSSAAEDNEKKETASKEKDSDKPVEITITDEDTSASVAEKLADAKLISSATEFESYVANEEKTNALQNGTFEIPAGSSHEEILKIITQ